MTEQMDRTESPDEGASISDSVERLIGSAKELAEAEVALAKLRGGIVAGGAKWIAILGVAAFIIAFGMIVTLMIGAVLALAPLWGLGLAVLAVTGAALLVILLCGMGISVQVGRIKGAFR